MDVAQRQWVSKLEKDVELKKNKRKEKNENGVLELDISDDDEKKNKKMWERQYQLICLKEWIKN